MKIMTCTSWNTAERVYMSTCCAAIVLGTDFGFYPNLGSIFDADFKISG